MRLKSRWVLAGVGLLGIATWNACLKVNNGSSATQSFMWVATTGDQMVRSYTIQLQGGAVAQVGDAQATGVQPRAMAITPDGLTVFLANSGDSSIGAYSVNGDGSLKAQGTTPSSGQQPVALAIDPKGNFLFAADQQSGDISAYKISSGSLTALGATPLQTPSAAISASPSALVVSPVGGFLYATDTVNNTVVGFAYDTNGVLTPIPDSAQGPCGLAGYCVQVGTNPSGLAFSRCAGISSATQVCGVADANNLFVSNAGSNSISAFSACIQTSASCATPNGTLVSTGPPVAACCGPTTLLVDSAANFVYGLEADAVGQFSYAPVTGTLTPLSPPSASTGSSPFSAGITANISNTNWIFVSNANASSLSGFSISGSGKLIGLASGPIPVPAQPTAILVR